MGFQDNTAWAAFAGDDAITCIANAAITGKRFVKIVGSNNPQEYLVAPAGAGDRIYGVALYSVASGGRVTVSRRDHITVTAGAAITPGAGVISDATGRAVPVAATARDYGVATTAAATDADVIVALNL